MSEQSLHYYTEELERLARRVGLDYHAVDFEIVPESVMTEIAVYGLPVRMPHWSFGVRYIHQLVRQSMGHSRIFEVMFPGDPCQAYLVDGNTLPENTLVTAHVLGHADFAKSNALFARFHAMAGANIIDMAAAHARRIEQAIDEFGVERVESVLDAALALESHVNIDQDLHRPRYPTQAPDQAEAGKDAFQERFERLPSSPVAEQPQTEERLPLPPHPEWDLLWFIANYGPELQQWERDVFLAVRAESMYFYPLFACQIMNEGWASYWHARLLREADFLPQDLYLSALKAHSDVVRPFATDEQTALAVNPYHLGYTLWEHIVDKHGLEHARTVCRDEDDFGFIRNYLDGDLAESAGLFTFTQKANGEIRVASRDIDAVREAILAPKYNYGAPRIAVAELARDGTLVLEHDAASDGRGLDLERANTVLKYVSRVWRRPVRLSTLDAGGAALDLSV